MARKKLISPPERKINNSVFNDIVNSFHSNSSYIFSTKSSYNSLISYSKEHTSDAEVSHRLKDFYRKDNEVIQRVKLIENIEKNLAKTLCQTVFGKNPSDPRTFFKNEFVRFLNGDLNNNLDEGTKALLGVSAEQIMYVQLENQLKSQGIKSTEAKNLIKRMNDELDDETRTRVKIAIDALNSSEIGNGLLLVQKLKNIQNIVAGKSDVLKVISQGKGLEQELISAYLLEKFLKTKAKPLANSAPSIVAEIVGNVNATNSGLGQMITNAISALLSGSYTRGGADKSSTTDVSAFVTSIDLSSNIRLNLDVKSSITNRYIKSNTKTTVNEIEQHIKGSSEVVNEDELNLALLIMINHASVFRTANTFAALHTQSRHILAGAILSNKSFYKSFIPEKTEIEKEDFQNLIYLNNKIYWYSELISSIANNVTERKFYEYAIMLDQTHSGLLASYAHQVYLPMLGKKHQLIRVFTKMDTAKKKEDYSYEDLYWAIKDDKQLKSFFQEYIRIVRSLSFRVSFKFGIDNFIGGSK